MPLKWAMLSRALTSASAGRPVLVQKRPRPAAHCPTPPNSAQLCPTLPSNSAPPSPRQSFSVLNHARSATLATSTVAPGPSTNDANYDLTTLPPDAPIDGRPPGLGCGLGSYQPHTQIVTTISGLRSADNEAASKKGLNVSLQGPGPANHWCCSSCYVCRFYD